MKTDQAKRHIFRNWYSWLMQSPEKVFHLYFPSCFFKDKKTTTRKCWCIQDHQSIDFKTKTIAGADRTAEAEVWQDRRRRKWTGGSWRRRNFSTATTTARGGIMLWEEARWRRRGGSWMWKGGGGAQLIALSWAGDRAKRGEKKKDRKQWTVKIKQYTEKLPLNSKQWKVNSKQ